MGSDDAEERRQINKKESIFKNRLVLDPIFNKKRKILNKWH